MQNYFKNTVILFYYRISVLPLLFLTRLKKTLKVYETNNFLKLKTRKESNRELMRYAGMGAQFLVSIAVGIFLGIKLDKWLKFSFPLLVWLLPLFIITGLIIKIIKDTSNK